MLRSNAIDFTIYLSGCQCLSESDGPAMTEARTTAHRRRSYGTPRRFLGHVLLAFLHFCAAGGSAVPLKKPPFLTGRRLADMSIHGASRNLLAPTTSPPATTAPPTPDTNDTASGPALVNLQCVSQGSKQLCPFVDPLPRPGTVTARGGIKMGMYEVTQVRLFLVLIHKLYFRISGVGKPKRFFELNLNPG